MGVVKLADYRPQLEVVEHRVADNPGANLRCWRRHSHPGNLIRLCRYRAVHQAGTESGSADFIWRQNAVCPGNG